MLASRRKLDGQRDVLRNVILSNKRVYDHVPREKGGQRNAVRRRGHYFGAERIVKFVATCMVAILFILRKGLFCVCGEVRFESDWTKIFFFFFFFFFSFSVSRINESWWCPYQCVRTSIHWRVAGVGLRGAAISVCVVVFEDVSFVVRSKSWMHGSDEVLVRTCKNKAQSHPSNRAQMVESHLTRIAVRRLWNQNSGDGVLCFGWFKKGIINNEMFTCQILHQVSSHQHVFQHDSEHYQPFD
jgi:hypothetical protein